MNNKLAVKDLINIGVFAALLLCSIVLTMKESMDRISIPS